MLLAGLISLGRWQLDRAGAKRLLEDGYARNTAAAPLYLADDGAGSWAARVATGELLFRPVTVTGAFQGPRQYLLDNQVHRHVAGYHVLTPLELKPGLAVLVNRGWVPVGASRHRLPEVPAPGAFLQVKAYMTALPGKGLVLGSAGYETPGWPKVVQWVDPDVIAAQMGMKLVPVMLKLADSQPHGYRRNWQPHASMPSSRHLGYAFQWFALAFTLAIIFLVLSCRQRSAPGLVNNDS